MQPADERDRKELGALRLTREARPVLALTSSDHRVPD
jgi:hypothetical protein